MATVFAGFFGGTSSMWQWLFFPGTLRIPNIPRVLKACEDPSNPGLPLSGIVESPQRQKVDSMSFGVDPNHLKPTKRG